MRQGQQHRRGRGRNNVNNNHPGNRKGQNPLTRSFESNGPDVKVRGTPAHIAEKYMQLARDAQSSGDHVLAENYLQHAEHYNRIILAYREQQIQQSGEMVNGSGRQHHHGQRHESHDSEDGIADDAGQPDDMTGLDQPMLVRHPGEMLREGQQPSLDEPRQQQPYRPDQQRFRDRHQRHERHDRQEGYERGERSERHGERGFDRQRDRQFRGSDQPGEAREMRMPREHREHRHSPDGPRETAPPAPSAEIPAGSDENQAPSRSEAAPRRRERFGLGADQPEFLRRPVRRPRREPDPDFTAEAPSSMPSAEEPPRE